MKQDRLKAIWEAEATAPRSMAELRKILYKPSFPALRIAKRNRAIETACFILFLGLYYGIFNGARDIFYGNLLLVVAFVLNVLHNILFCRFVAGGGNTHNVADALRLRLKQLKRFTVIVIAIRSLVICLLVLFFSIMIRMESEKMWLLRGMIIFLTVRLMLFIRFAAKWIRQLAEVIVQMHPLTWLLKDDDPVQALKDRARR